MKVYSLISKFLCAIFLIIYPQCEQLSINVHAYTHTENVNQEEYSKNHNKLIHKNLTPRNLNVSRVCICINNPLWHIVLISYVMNKQAGH